MDKLPSMMAEKTDVLSTINTNPEDILLPSGTLNSLQEEIVNLQFQLGGSCTNVFSQSMTLKNSSVSDSFVVINDSAGKNSLEFFPAEFSLANFQNIQEALLSKDYSSMVSNINPDEIQTKLVEVLQENSKLKETLLRNNETMKKNYTSLLTWQETVHSLLNLHKTKFSEIRDLVYQLKKENSELKMKVASKTGSTDCQKNSVLDCTNGDEVKNTIKQLIDVENDAPNETKTSSVMDTLVPVPKKSLELMVAESADPKPAESVSWTSLTESKVESYVHIVPEAEHHSEDASRNSLQDNSEDQIQLGEKVHCEVEKNLAELRNDIQNLDLTSPKFQESCPRRSCLLHNVKHYSDLLDRIIDFHAVERARFHTVQENLAKCEKILAQVALQHGPDSEKSNLLKGSQFQIEKLRSQFLQDIVKYGDESKQLIELQKLFQKIFWEYSGLVSELEILEEENSKMKALDGNEKEKKRVLDDLTKEFVDKIRVLTLREQEYKEKEEQRTKEEMEERLPEDTRIKMKTQAMEIARNMKSVQRMIDDVKRGKKKCCKKNCYKK